MNTTNPDISLSSAAPCEEPKRQYYYIEKARTYIQKKSLEIGRPLTFCVTTFGCQMNARDSEKLRGILEKIGYEEAPEDVAEPPYDDRSLRLHDARAGSGGEVKEKLPFC